MTDTLQEYAENIGGGDGDAAAAAESDKAYVADMIRALEARGGEGEENGEASAARPSAPAVPSFHDDGGEADGGATPPGDGGATPPTADGDVTP